MATCRVNTQKSADGIVVPGIKDEGPNVEMNGASNKLDVGVESDRMSQTPARHGIAFPRSCLNRTSCMRCGLDLIWLRPDDFREPPIADPHDVAVWGGTVKRRPLPDYTRSLILWICTQAKMDSQPSSGGLAFCSVFCWG